ncbi:hypothetical protein [Sorangium sp. So ce388]|uniref:hypothetical protein n=1 Tax=Sorangium sp. So ce388 TaxID=3133309 RepID=UPI003F5B33CC
MARDDLARERLAALAAAPEPGGVPSARPSAERSGTQAITAPRGRPLLRLLPALLRDLAVSASIADRLFAMMIACSP